MIEVTFALSPMGRMNLGGCGNPMERTLGRPHAKILWSRTVDRGTTAATSITVRWWAYDFWRNMDWK